MPRSRSDPFARIYREFERMDKPKPSLIERLQERTGKAVTPAGRLREAIVETAEFRRIRDLPRRNWQEKEGLEILIEEMTDLLKKPKGAQTLRPVQAVALAELHDLGGLFAPMRVGSGKTLVSFLAAHPDITGAKRAILFVPASLVEKTRRDVYEAAKHWQIPPITIESYQMLSRDRDGKILGQLRPDLVILDEAHYMKNTSAGCWRRLNEYLKEARRAEEFHVHVVAMSGTITTRSLREYWHLLRACLGDNAPLPHNLDEFKKWCAAIDEKVSPEARVLPGALVRLAPNPEGADVLARARDAYGKRLIASPGVVSTMGDRPPMSLNLKATHLPAPAHLRDAITTMRRTYRTPDDHPFEMAMELWRHARELQCGFYYVWDPRPPPEWLIPRSEWSKWVRDKLASKARNKFHTVGDFIRVLQHPEQVDKLPEWFEEGLQYWRAWQEAKPLFKPNTVARWVDDTTLKYAADWLESGSTKSKLCWVEHREMGPKLEQLTGVPYFGSGALNSSGIYLENHTGPAIVSVYTASAGLNLQYKWHQNLYVSPMSTNKDWEQSLGRTHRDLQPEDEVTAEVLMMCREAYSSMVWAIRGAEYAQPTNGPQKLVYCTRDLGEIENLISRRNDELWKDELEGI